MQFRKAAAIAIFTLGGGAAGFWALERVRVDRRRARLTELQTEYATLLAQRDRLRSEKASP